MEITSGKPINESVKEYTRGVIGGLIFSFPLLYTMEIWWAAYMADPIDLLLLFLFTYALLLGYNRYSGMHPGIGWKSIFIESMEELGIGILLSFAILALLNLLSFNIASLDEIIGKVLIEGMVISIGVSIGTAQLQDSNSEEVDKEEKNDDDTNEKPNEDIDKEEKVDDRSGRTALAVLALCGSIVIGGNVAPTEEVLTLAVGAKSIHLLLMVVVSLALCSITTYFIDFKGTSNGGESTTFKIIFDTCLSYCVALAASAFILWYFGRFYNNGFDINLAQVVVLGVISSLGASAGRLLIK